MLLDVLGDLILGEGLDVRNAVVEILLGRTLGIDAVTDVGLDLARGQQLANRQCTVALDHIGSLLGDLKDLVVA